MAQRNHNRKTRFHRKDYSDTYKKIREREVTNSLTMTVEGRGSERAHGSIIIIERDKKMSDKRNFVKAKHLGNIHRYTPITLYPIVPLSNIIIIFDTVVRQK